ncbi:MAG: ECF transporter S component [Patescibacteria group bacterium]
MIKSKIKILIIFVGCFLFRLIPFRAPNVEPIMASIMPIGKKYGFLYGFLFGFLSIFLFDLVTHFGSWTWIAGITYGLIGAISAFYFKKFKSSIFNFVIFAFCATIIFDLITGVLFAPIFHQTILNALILQIPFTILHLAGSIGFALTLTPVLNRWLLSEKMLSFKSSLKTSLLKN